VSLRKDEYAIVKYKYDEQNRQIEYAQYNYLERPLNNKNGWHRYVTSYEKSGVKYDINYAANGSVVSEWKYDPTTDKWTRIDGWRQYFENLKQRLPVSHNDYTRLTALTLSGNTCSITVSINFSKYDLSGEDMITLEDEGKSLAEFLRDDYEMPRYAALVLYGIDNANRELYRITY
jgi:hypothetical protein